LPRRVKEAEPVQKGFIVGVIAAKGGLCTSTVALNLAISYHNRTKEKVIAAEIRPSQGTWGLELGYGSSESLNNLLRLKSTEITTAKVENELVQTTRGIRLLLASSNPKDSELISAGMQLYEVIQKLSQLAQVVFLDLGSPYLPILDNVVSICHEIILLTEPQPLTIQRTKPLLDMLMENGYGKSKFLSVVLTNRFPAAIQYSIFQVQELLKYPVSETIPPAAEQAYQAFTKNIPIIEFQRGSLLSQQYEKLADIVQSHILS